jgi:hypothetical protein
MREVVWDADAVRDDVRVLSSTNSPTGTRCRRLLLDGGGAVCDEEPRDEGMGTMGVGYIGLPTVRAVFHDQVVICPPPIVDCGVFVDDRRARGIPRRHATPYQILTLARVVLAQKLAG